MDQQTHPQVWRQPQKRFTLMGHSAGGASVHYHFLSPLATGALIIAFFFSIFGLNLQKRSL
jgi:Carboxylesterase family